MHCYATQSLEAIAHEPGTLAACGTTLGWRSALVRLYRGTAASDAFDTVLTPDQTIVVHLSGHTELKVAAGGLWHTTVTQPGSVGLTPPGESSRLRWRTLGDEPCLSAHLHLPQPLLDEARDHHRRGTPQRLNTASSDDAGVASIVRAIVTGLHAAESELFLESALQRLAGALLDPPRRWEDHGDAVTHIDDRRIRRAIDYMNHHLAGSVDLDTVACEAGISKFHFVRSFRRHVGLTPHAWLKAMRLTTARRMLRASDLPVATIAGLVGYETSRNFSTAFTAHFGMTPSAARRARVDAA